MMVYTNELEREIQEGTTYWDCFKTADLRRTEIACLVWAAQNLCGAGLMGYSTYFYEQAGLSTEGSFDLSLAQYAIGIIGTVFSWVLMSYFGRRTLYLGGLMCLCVFLFIVGFIGIAPSSNATAWATGSMLLVYTFFYDSSVGPVCYSLVAEIPSSRLRTKTVVLARNLYNLFSIVNGVIIPYMLNPVAWNWRGKAGFFWGALCALCVVWTFFRLPEPKGRTFGEMDVLFEQGISARKFNKTEIDAFQSHVNEKEIEIIHEETKA
jgi:SP family general alpha glucoside:H+ symporter-like MFS transporter